MTSNGSYLVAAGAALTLVGGAVGYWFGRSAESAFEDYDVVDDAGDEPCKMVLVVRKDLPMTKGKIAAQCGHAAVACYEKALVKAPRVVDAWKSAGQAKIALQCDGLEELQRIRMRAARLGMVAEVIVDAGRTQIDPGSTTVLGVGPAPVKLVNEVTGHLKLL